jgi:3-methyladenine DNA glycosylase AlkD
MTRSEQVLQAIESLASSKVRESLARFGIPIDNARGVSTPALHALARKLGHDHELAARLWESGCFEARAVAAMIEEPDKVSRAQMDRWASEFNSWAICDCCCCYLFRKTPFAWSKAVTWAERKPEFVKRAGFALMAYLAIHDKEADDASFLKLVSIIERESDDDRPFVRKAVNWALRQLSKRNARLHPAAVAAAERIRGRGTRSARWIATEALRELRNEKVLARLRSKGEKG